MKLNENTIFPIGIFIMGVFIITGSGDEPISSKFLLELGVWQQPVGLLLILVGALLYKRASRK